MKSLRWCPTAHDAMFLATNSHKCLLTLLDYANAKFPSNSSKMSIESLARLEGVQAVDFNHIEVCLQALVDDATFCGLPLDEDNEDDKTLERVKAWVGQLKGEMSL